MRRTLEYRINTDLQNSTIKYFLKTKGYSSGNLIALKKYESGILVNSQPAHVNQLLNPGDTLTINIMEEAASEKINPVELPLDIVYEDEDLLVINKPAGMPIHPSANNYDTSVANALAWYFDKQGIPFVFRCINRLDKDTSGLTIVAKNFVSAGILSHMVSMKSSALSGIQREYLAIVRCSLTPPSGIIDVPIGRKPGSVIERMVDYENGEHAVTHYKLVKEANGHSLVSLQLETGRTHQIRIHMKHIGFPLIGDYLYNPDREFIDRQALHSHKLTFTHPITGEKMTFTAPLPSDMQAVLYPAQRRN